MTRKPPKMELFGPIHSPRHLLEVYCCWIFSPILLKWRANSGNSNGGLKFSSEIWCFCLFKVDYGYGGSWIHIQWWILWFAWGCLSRSRVIACHGTSDRRYLLEMGADRDAKNKDSQTSGGIILSFHQGGLLGWRLMNVAVENKMPGVPAYIHSLIHIPTYRCIYRHIYICT